MNGKKKKAEEKKKEKRFEAPGKTVLVVDDSTINLKVFCSLLKKRMMNIDTAKSGKEAIDKVRHKEYDIIFMDHMMPEMDGIETFHAMKEMSDNKSKDAPVVILTANAIVGVRDEYMKEGFNDYLSKPIEVEKLEMMIKEMLKIE